VNAGVSLARTVLAALCLFACSS